MEAEMSKKIGWQKYEEMIKSQMSSPFASLLLTNNLNMIDFSEDQEDLDEIDLEMLQDSEKDLLVVPVPENFNEQLSLLTNYECWVGHTNFDITESIKSAVEKTDGVEILKICSRYRFFIGVGKMFNFSEVRKEIESNTL
tara:strand:- start:3814 stop:4233 length:420 start_codon:yes stop_codon:yes gene_type:complete